MEDQDHNEPIELDPEPPNPLVIGQVFELIAMVIR